MELHRLNGLGFTLTLHLAVAGKCLSGIAGHFLHPSAQHIFMKVEVPRSLSNAHAALANKSHGLDLELSTEFTPYASGICRGVASLMINWPHEGCSGQR